MAERAYMEVGSCRVCGSSSFSPILSLGRQVLTGVFPSHPDEPLPAGPLDLVQCDTAISGSCGLVQLRHSFRSSDLYGDSYGYRSSLNRSMMRHLESTVGVVRSIRPPRGGVVLDIGSNDGTLLSFYEPGEATLVGIDPTAAKFRRFYRSDIAVVTKFFSREAVAEAIGTRKVAIITSIAMFYDLADPLAFMREIESLLEDDGIWHLEQSYLPAMLSVNAYDTICHEHLEYYGLRQIAWMADRAGLKIIRVEMNDVNGGSFAVTLARKKSSFPEAPETERVLELEREALTPERFAAFAGAVKRHRSDLLETLETLRGDGRLILGYGASTKGNVILQYCGIDSSLIPFIAEVNEEKFGRFTPGTGIPIVSEADAHAMKPDVFVVMPWHFRPSICERESAFLDGGGSLLFPLPSIETVRR